VRRWLALLAVAALPAAAQETRTSGRDDFRPTEVPAGRDARFLCHQGGAEILGLQRVARVVPARVQGLMTFAVTTREGETHLVYAGPTTTCRLAVSP